MLKVTKETPANEVRSNYMRLSRLVHPDKCTHPDASKASAVLNQVQSEHALYPNLVPPYYRDRNPGPHPSSKMPARGVFEQGNMPSSFRFLAG